MFKQNKVDFVITEDSDLLVFGVTKVFFKMDLNGKGMEIDLTNIHKCNEFKMPASKKGDNLFNQDLLIKTCVLSGCDYLESIKGIGFKTALKLVKQF